MISDSPEATASSTTYWMVGLSTIGSISLGWAFVAGRKRVPRPAAGNTALRIVMAHSPLAGSGSVPAAGRLFDHRSWAMSRHPRGCLALDSPPGKQAKGNHIGERRRHSSQHTGPHEERERDVIEERREIAPGEAP